LKIFSNRLGGKRPMGNSDGIQKSRHRLPHHQMFRGIFPFKPAPRDQKKTPNSA
jgi:hypothetical protein